MLGRERILSTTSSPNSAALLRVVVHSLEILCTQGKPARLCDATRSREINLRVFTQFASDRKLHCGRMAANDRAKLTATRDTIA